MGLGHTDGRDGEDDSLKGRRIEKSFLAFELDTPRIGPLGGKLSPLEEAMPVQTLTILV